MAENYSRGRRGILNVVLLFVCFFIVVVCLLLFISLFCFVAHVSSLDHVINPQECLREHEFPRLGAIVPNKSVLTES